MTSGTIRPLLKDKFGNRESSENYRPIIASSVILKLLEYSILRKINKLIITDARQFGFKKQASTHFANLIFKEVCLNYMETNSVVYAAFLDLSKAFDKVDHSILFDKLIARGFDRKMVEFLKTWYHQQEVKVTFNGSEATTSWYLKNGVRQGSVLSSYFFIIYIDDIIKKISKKNVGCKIEYLILNIICYADDITLLAPSIRSLQELIDALGLEIAKIGLTINTKKSICMKLSRKKKILDESPKRNIFINGKKLNFVKETKYLGFQIDESLSNLSDIIRVRNKFYSSFNMLLRKFHYITVDAFIVLFKSICLQFYGSELWFNNLKCLTALRKFGVGFHKAVKKIIGCPFYFSNHEMCYNLNMFTFPHHINWDLIRFTNNVLNSENELFISLSKYLKYRSFIITKTQRILKDKYNVCDILTNDIDAIKARIFYVQNRIEYLDFCSI